MAGAPVYASTPNPVSALLATFDASFTAPTNVSSLVVAGANGSQVFELLCQAVATTVAGLVNVFRFDGTTYHLIDQFAVPAVTASTTGVAWREARPKTGLILKSGDTLRLSHTVAGNNSVIKATAWAADF